MKFRIYGNTRKFGCWEFKDTHNGWQKMCLLFGVILDLSRGRCFCLREIVNGEPVLVKTYVVTSVAVCEMLHTFASASAEQLLVSIPNFRFEDETIFAERVFGCGSHGTLYITKQGNAKRFIKCCYSLDAFKRWHTAFNREADHDWSYSIKGSPLLVG